MITPKESPSRAVLERIANDYRRQGYDVLVEPRGADLPEFLGDATPDLIARRHGESVVIEVKRTPSDVDRQQLESIAGRIASQPGWQFVLMAPGVTEANDSAELTSLDEASVQELIREAGTVVQLDMPAAALMCAWAAAEGAARLLVARSGVRLHRSDTASLVRSLVSEGFVTDADFELLNEAAHFRSLIAHGRSPVRDAAANRAKETARSLLELASRMLTELRPAA